MRMLIFGCGYLGKRVATAWKEDGNTVFAVTRSEKNGEAFRQNGLQPVIGDICDSASLSDLPIVDVVLQAVGYDQNSGKSKEEVVCNGMRNVLDAVRGRCSQFISISSTSVYGQSEGEWVDEDSPCDPMQPAGQITLSAEQLIRDRFSSDTATHASILRLAGIYGPDRLLARVESLRTGNAISGNGESWLNLIHVDDAVSAISKVVKREAGTGTFNVVDDRPIRRREYYESLAKLVAAPAPIFDAGVPSARGSGGLNKRCSNQRIRSALGWIPAYSSIVTGLPAALGDLASKSARDSE